MSVNVAEAGHPSLGRAVSLLVGRRGLITLLSGVGAIEVARVLGAGSYGTYQAAISTWTLLSSASDFGFSLALARDFARFPERRALMLRASLALQLAFSVLLGAVLIVSALAAGWNTTRGLCLLILVPSLLTNAVAGARVLFVALLDVAVTVRIDLITTGLQIPLLIAVALAGTGAVGASIVISATTGLSSLWVARAANRREGRVPLTWNACRLLIRAAAPLGVMAILSKVYVSVDLVLLGFYNLGSQLGQYAVAAKIILLLNMIPAIVFSVGLPALSRHGDSPAAFGLELSKLIRIVFAGLVPLFAIAGLFARPLLLVAFGRQFGAAAEILSILSIAGALGLLSQTFGTVLVSRDRVRSMFWSNSIAVIANIGLNLWLIPVYGPLSSAWITVATEGFIAGYSWLLFRKLAITELSLKAPMAALAVSGGAVIMGIALRRNPGLSVIVVLIIFGAGYILLGLLPIHRIRGVRYRSVKRGLHGPKANDIPSAAPASYLRIVQVTAVREPGGVWTHVLAIASYLQQSGHQVVVALPVEQTQLTMDLDKLNIAHVPLNKVHRMRADIFHLHLHKTYDFEVAWLQAKLRAWGRSGLILTEHLPRTPASDASLALDPYQTHGRRKPGATLGKTLFKRLQIANVGHVLTVSGSCRDFMRVRYKTRLRKLSVIVNGVNIPTSWTGIAVGTARPLDVVAVGSLVWRKGFDVLIDAAKVSQEPWTASIYGVGPLLEVLTAQASAVWPRIQFRGWCADGPAVAENFDVICVPSRAEAIGYVGIEAMARGRPVVASNVDGLPEVVASSADGILFEQENAAELAAQLDSLSRNRNVLADMGVSSRRTAEEKFGVDMMMQKILHVYERAAKGGAPNER